MEIEISEDPDDTVNLNIDEFPILITLTQLGVPSDTLEFSYIVDPTLLEEACSSGQIILAIHRSGLFSSVFSSFAGVFSPSELFEMVRSGKKIGMELHRKLDSLCQQAACRTNRGFLSGGF
eukprot:Sdes_comp20603_c0_seq1m15621